MSFQVVGSEQYGFTNLTEWKLLAMRSSERNLERAAYRIGACEVDYDGISLALDSRERLNAAYRMKCMVDLLTRPGLFITSDGAVGVGRISQNVPLIPSAKLILAYNVAHLTSPDVNYLICNEQITRMTLCVVDMGSFRRELESERQPALLLTGIGWWGVDQRRE